MAAALHLLRYLINTKHFKPTFGGGTLNPIGFADADFGNRMHDGKSISGQVFVLNNGIVMWNSHVRDTVALSTKDAGYIALSRMFTRSHCPDPIPKQTPNNAFSASIFLRQYERNSDFRLSHSLSQNEAHRNRISLY
jgi:hypothetical protein